jgi:hypothetical protein
MISTALPDLRSAALHTACRLANNTKCFLLPLPLPLLLPLQSRFAGVKLSAHGGGIAACGRCIRAECANATLCPAGVRPVRWVCAHSSHAFENIPAARSGILAAAD